MRVKALRGLTQHLRKSIVFLLTSAMMMGAFAATANASMNDFRGLSFFSNAVRFGQTVLRNEISQERPAELTTQAEPDKAVSPTQLARHNQAVYPWAVKDSNNLTAQEEDRDGNYNLPGDTIRHTITVGNDGNDEEGTLKNVTITSVLPDGVTLDLAGNNTVQRLFVGDDNVEEWRAQTATYTTATRTLTITVASNLFKDDEFVVRFNVTIDSDTYNETLISTNEVSGNQYIGGRKGDHFSITILDELEILPDLFHGELNTVIGSALTTAAAAPYRTVSGIGASETIGHAYLLRNAKLPNGNLSLDGTVIWRNMNVVFCAYTLDPDLPRPGDPLYNLIPWNEIPGAWSITIPDEHEVMVGDIIWVRMWDPSTDRYLDELRYEIFSHNVDFIDEFGGNEVDSQTIFGWEQTHFGVTNQPPPVRPRSLMLVQEPTIPPMDNHTLLGWFNDPVAGNTAWNFTTDTVNGNITLYTRWQADKLEPIGDDDFVVTIISDAEGGVTNAGATIKYTVTASNNLEWSLLEGAVMTVVLPEYATFEPGSVEIDGITSSYMFDPVTRVLTVVLGNIEGIGSKEITYQIKVNSDAHGEELKTSVVVAGTCAASGAAVSDSAVLTITVTPKSVAPTIDPITEGDRTVTGTGVPGAEITVTWPNGSESDPVKVDPDGNWTVDVPSNMNLIEGDKVNAVQEEPNKYPSDSVEVTVGAGSRPPINVSVEKTSNVIDGKTSVGQEIIYTVIARNNGPYGSLWRDAVMTDEIPAGVTLDVSSVRINNNTPTAGDVSFTNDTLTVNLGSIASGEFVTVSYTVEVNAGTYGATITNRATVNGKDGNSDNDVKEYGETTIVVNSPPVEINLAFIGYYLYNGNVLSTSIHWQNLKEGDMVDWDAVDAAYAEWVANGGLVPRRETWQTSGYASFTFADYAALGFGDFNLGQLENYYLAYFVSPGYILSPVEVNLGFIGYYLHEGRILNTSFYWQTLKAGDVIDWDAVDAAYANWVAQGGFAPCSGLWRTSGPDSFTFAYRAPLGFGDFNLGQLETFYIAHYVSASHTPVIVSDTAATCTIDGLLLIICDVCDIEMIRAVQPAIGHEYKTVTIDATCETAGSITVTCNREGCDYEDVTKIPATGHEWGVWVVTIPPTATTPGEETRACTICGNLETRAIPQTGQPIEVSIGFIGYYLHNGRVLSTSIHWQTLLKEGDMIDWDAIDAAYADWVARGGLMPCREIWQTSGSNPFTFGYRDPLGFGDFDSGQLENFFQVHFVSPGYIL